MYLLALSKNVSRVFVFYIVYNTNAYKWIVINHSKNVGTDKPMFVWNHYSVL